MAPLNSTVTATGISMDISNHRSTNSAMDEGRKRRNCSDKNVLRKQCSSSSTGSTSSTLSLSSNDIDSKRAVGFVATVMVHYMVQHTKKERTAMYFNEYDWYRMKLDTFETVQALQEPHAQAFINDEGVVTSDSDDQMLECSGKSIRGLESMKSKAHHAKKAAMQRLHAYTVLEAQRYNQDRGSNVAAREARLALISQQMSQRSSRIAQARAKADQVAAKKCCESK